MAKLDYDKLQKELFNRTEGYAASVRKHYLAAFNEIIELVKRTELEEDKPFSFSEYGYTDDVQPIFRNMYSRVYQTIRGGIEREWLNSNKHTDNLVKAVFGPESIEDNHYARYFVRNKASMDAFFARKSADGGLNLSQRVWKYTGRFKEELEDTLDLALGEGTPYAKLAAKVKQYLNDPDRYYRRFRYKVGEDENGKPIYGLKWKRRVFDKTTGLYSWVDDKPSQYSPGRGVYRSSARNAQRLARTETNLAYRTADYDRWQNLDFVVGVEIKLSNNHPVLDICDDLKGRYPKDFKWTGWHPNCRCHMVPVLASPEEVDRMTENILDGKDPRDGVKCEDEIRNIPEEFSQWMQKNESRISEAKERGTLPYFISDNQRFLGVIISSQYRGFGTYNGSKLGRFATKKAMALYSNAGPITLTAEIRTNAEEAAAAIGINLSPPMSFLEADNGRANTGFSKGGLFFDNCQSTAVVHEARLRGLNITAQPYSFDVNSVQYILGEDFNKAWKNAKGNTPQVSMLRGKTDMEILQKIDQQTLVPGRYHIGLNFKNGEGHLLTAERIDQKLLVYDAQRGVFVNILEEKNLEYAEVLKVDKLMFVVDILKQISKPI